MADTVDIITLADMREYMRVDSHDDDAQIVAMLDAARGVVEGWCGPLDDFADGVPAALVQAMKMLVAHLYENREATVAGDVAEAPLGFFHLIDPYRLREC